MTVQPTCPSCGMRSEEMRCPRCNTLKVVGCSGSCLLCKSSCETETLSSPPSESAREDAEHPGTPLER